MNNLLLLLILFSAFLCSSDFGFSQTTNQMQCTLSEREILQSQTFNEDAPESEEAREIVRSLLIEFAEVYNLINSNQLSEIESHLSIIHQRIDAANTINLNYSMFDADLEFIEQFN